MGIVFLSVGINEEHSYYHNDNDDLLDFLPSPLQHKVPEVQQY